MVSSRVEIDSLSWREGAQSVHWSSEDGMSYELSASDKADVGTCITLHLNDDEKEFLEKYTVRSVLDKYCAFMPVPIFLSEVKAPEDKKDESAGGDAEDKPEAQSEEKP